MSGFSFAKTAAIGLGAFAIASLGIEAGGELIGLKGDAYAASESGKRHMGGGNGAMGGKRAGAGGSAHSVEEMVFKGGRMWVVTEEDKGDPYGHRPDSSQGGAGGSKGDLYADLFIVLRDPTTGIPLTATVTEDNVTLTGLVVEVCSGDSCAYAIFDEGAELWSSSAYEAVVEDDGGWNVTLGDAAFDVDLNSETPTTQIVEADIGRLNVVRAPNVLDNALDEAISKIVTSEAEITYDAAGRIVYVLDGVSYAIDSPLENLALYQAIMLDTDGVITVELKGGETLTWDVPEDLNPATFLGAATDKESAMSLDEVVYVNVFLETITKDGDEISAYYTGAAEDYLRSSLFQTDDGKDIMVTYYVLNPDGTMSEPITETLLAAALGDDASLEWVDPTADYNLDDLYQAAEDTRAVIEFIHGSIVADIFPSS